jgi:transcription factor IIIB 90 kDa subunit
MQTGRRPAGICAASLFIAARMHNFNRSVREIILVTKIGEGAVRTRYRILIKTEGVWKHTVWRVECW